MSRMIFIFLQDDKISYVEKGTSSEWREGDFGYKQLFEFGWNNPPPQEFINALRDDEVLKVCFNGEFTKGALDGFFKIKTSLSSWFCLQVRAMALGLPHSFDEVLRVLNIREENKTIALIKLWCFVRNYPYCEREKKLYEVDQIINQRGVLVDYEFIDQAIIYHNMHRERLISEGKKISNISNINSPKEVKNYLLEKGYEVKSLTKEITKELIETTDDSEVKRVLEIRNELSKTSIKKYEAMKKWRCADGRIRGLFKFYGASRTGRWAGRLVQVHNLPRNKHKDLGFARVLLKKGEYSMMDFLFGSPSEILSELIRTAFIGEKGRVIISDFSAIEARIIAWLAGEQWRIDVFNSHGNIYEASASKMFKVPIEEVTKDSPYRDKGKIAELALGYGGGVEALKAMGGLKMGLDERELKSLVKIWRGNNSKIVELHKSIQLAATGVVGDGIARSIHQGVKLSLEKGILFITLPSGRRLGYFNPRLERDERFGGVSLCFDGIDQTTKKWGKVRTYGGKLTENIVQAIARDILGEGLIRLEDRGFKVVLHVHDEVVIEAEDSQTVEDVNEILSEEVEWARGLVLKAEGFENKFYRK
ncbi:MAG: DNA polymerase [Clostridium sp.]